MNADEIRKRGNHVVSSFIPPVRARGARNTRPAMARIRSYQIVGDRVFFCESVEIDHKQAEHAEVMEIPPGGDEEDAVATGIRLWPGFAGIYFAAMQGLSCHFSSVDRGPRIEQWWEKISPERAAEIMAGCLADASEDAQMRVYLTPEHWAVGIRTPGMNGGIQIPCESEQAAIQLSREKGGHVVHVLGGDEAMTREMVCRIRQGGRALLASGVRRQGQRGADRTRPAPNGGSVRQVGPSVRH